MLSSNINKLSTLPNIPYFELLLDILIPSKSNLSVLTEDRLSKIGESSFSDIEPDKTKEFIFKSGDKFSNLTTLFNPEVDSPIKVLFSSIDITAAALAKIELPNACPFCQARVFVCVFP